MIPRFWITAIHKKKNFAEATVAIFIFDILFIDGRQLINEPLSERRKILEQNINEIPHRVALSECREITDAECMGSSAGEEVLTEMMTRVLHTWFFFSY